MDLPPAGRKVMAPEKSNRRRRGDTEGSIRAIEEAALKLFLQKGYSSTTTDQIAALARVSKRSIYRFFPDKEQLFSSLLKDSVKRSRDFLASIAQLLEDANELEPLLLSIAERYVETVFQDPVLGLRRLVISEARLFPELALHYYDEVSQKVIESLALGFRGLMEKGIMKRPVWKTGGTSLDAAAEMAARHFASLLILLPLDAAMFGKKAEQSQTNRQVLAAMEAFALIYSP